MSVYSIAMPRCQLLFERRKGNNICYLRGLSMQNTDFELGIQASVVSIIPEDRLSF